MKRLVAKRGGDRPVAFCDVELEAKEVGPDSQYTYLDQAGQSIFLVAFMGVIRFQRKDKGLVVKALRDLADLVEIGVS